MILPNSAVGAGKARSQEQRCLPSAPLVAVPPPSRLSAAGRPLSGAVGGRLAGRRRGSVPGPLGAPAVLNGQAIRRGSRRVVWL